MVFGIINIALGGFGLLGLPMSIVMFYTSYGKTFGVEDMLKAIPEYASWMRILIIPGGIFACLQLYAGIGLVKAREGARKLAIACAIYGIIAALLLAYLNMEYVMPYSTENALKLSPSTAGKEQGFIQMMQLITKASAIVGVLFSLLPPVGNLIFLSQKRVRDYCLLREAERQRQTHA